MWNTAENFINLRTFMANKKTSFVFRIFFKIIRNSSNEKKGKTIKKKEAIYSYRDSRQESEAAEWRLKKKINGIFSITGVSCIFSI